MKISSTLTIGVTGTIWDPAQGESLKTLVIANGKITQIMDGAQNVPGATMITLDAGTVIFPGLVNLHTHTTYNILPIWENGAVWKNRFQWRHNQGYKQQIGDLLYYIQTNWTEASADTAYAIISEIQAVAGGTSLIQETMPLDESKTGGGSFIIRNTGDQADLQIPSTENISSVVDFYQPNVTPSGDPGEDTSSWTPVKEKSYYADFVKSVNNRNNPYYSTLVHVGEGKSGFIKGSSPDPYSQKEIALLYQGLGADLTRPGDLAGAHLGLTHGCGIDVSNTALLDFLSANQVSLIWSPVSNLLLYLDTTDVSKLLAKGINICLGSDWSPSGSKHVLDELKFAKYVNDLLGLGISNSQLFAMVTSNPVKALGITGTGAIAVGYDADLFVLRKANAADDALTALLACSDSDIDFVMVNGRVVFGLTSYFKDVLQVDYQGFPATEGANAAQRGVSINSSVSFDLVASLNTIDTLMQKYCTTVIDEPQLKRTRFLAADDPVYQGNIKALRTQLDRLYGVP
jgi:5-methylthioadenosine/S-adenosylhomocysteine deaminase